MTSDRLAELRAELEVAEAALKDLPEKASAAVQKAAKAKLAAAQTALREHHVEAKKREDAKGKLETRPAEAAPETRNKTLQEFTNEASTQDVRGTQDLSPEDQAARRNPNR